MRIFLDTANVQAIEQALSLGIIDGITTNPTLLAQEKEKPLLIIKQITTMFPDGLINIEITETIFEKAYAQALKIYELGNNVIVKIPAHANYIPLIHSLVKQKIPVNATLVFSVAQAACMAKLGVQYVSPFIGRLYDNQIDGIHVLQEMIDCYKAYRFSTNLLAASLRTVEQINSALVLGVDVITVSPTLLQKMFFHQLTDQGIERFTKDWHTKENGLFL